jgi:hypothetical protein
VAEYYPGMQESEETRLYDISNPNAQRDVLRGYKMGGEDSSDRITLHEARMAVKDLQALEKMGPDFGYGEYEKATLDRAKEIVRLGNRNIAKNQLLEADPNTVASEYDFLARLDVESNKEVGKAQKILQKYGYYTDEIDNLYGVNTKEARLAMQNDVLANQKFTINWLMDQARGLFQNWDVD